MGKNNKKKAKSKKKQTTVLIEQKVPQKDENIENRSINISFGVLVTIFFTSSVILAGLMWFLRENIITLNSNERITKENIEKLEKSLDTNTQKAWENYTSVKTLSVRVKNLEKVVQ